MEVKQEEYNKDCFAFGKIKTDGKTNKTTVDCRALSDEIKNCVGCKFYKNRIVWANEVEGDGLYEK